MFPFVKYAIGVALWVALSALPALGQAPSLSLDALLAEVEASNPSLRAARLEADALATVGDQVGALPDPTVSVTAFPYPLVTALGAQRTQWRIEQMLPWPGTLALRERAADLGAEAAGFEADALGRLGGKGRVTGNPVRSEFFEAASGPKEPGGRVRILIFGGSQGSRAINNAMIGALGQIDDLADRVDIVHQTGVAQHDERVRARDAVARQSLRALKAAHRGPDVCIIARRIDGRMWILNLKIRAYFLICITKIINNYK